MDDAGELTEAEVNDLLSDDDRNAGWEDAEPPGPPRAKQRRWSTIPVRLTVRLWKDGP
ncbi:hypothetical protein ACFY0A_24510 [Streptomyces sp. NPDC001698]|uniref:hypothetical protein n=1 Tax=unclassified Streptomyces TaxID=2593676 RepID=UPI00368A03F2